MAEKVEIELTKSSGVFAGTPEDLNEKHRREKKELQSRVQSLKKTITKGDRKKKKEVDAEIEQLEKDFELRCQIELKALEGSKEKTTDSATNIDENTAQPVVATATAAATAIAEPLNGADDDQAAVAAAVAAPSKASKSKKRREKKEKEQQERDSQAVQHEKESRNGPAFVELSKIKEKLRAKRLQIKDVFADGNCLYYAVADQLNQTRRAPEPPPAANCQQLRELASDFMLSHPDDFRAYLCSDGDGDGDGNGGDVLNEYCQKIRSSTMWGGHLELKALSESLGVAIEVIQAEGAELVIGDCADVRGDDNSKQRDRLVITYHRHMLGSGEHYNSTQPANLNDSEVDDND